MRTVRSSLTVAGLVAAYGFDEGTGTATSDDTENAHDAALTGQTWVAGKYGNALDFDGSYLTAAASSLLELDGAMTLSAWVMPTGEVSDWRTVIAKEDGPNPEYALYADGNPSAPHAIVTAAGGTYVQAVGNQSLPTGEWSHLAATFDGSNLALYLNGKPMSSAAAGGPLATSSGPLLIGGSAFWGEYFEGVIDEVRVYDRALSLAELKADIHTPVNPAGLDTTPPSVMVTAPLQSSAVAGVVQLEAEASDDVSVANVKFFIDGNLLSEDDWPPYTAQWNSVSEAAGAHSLTARAYDAAGNEGTSSAVSVTVLENALVAAYSFDEGSGSELHDITGNGNDATVSGPIWATGKYGSALSFDGDYITIADASLLDLTAGITLSAWVQPLASHVNWPTIILKEKPGGLSYALLSEWTGTAPSVCIGALGEEDDCVLGGVAPTETWTHLAGTFDGFESRIYVNGELAGSVIQTIPAGVSGEPLRIGGNAIWGNEYFVGLIDEVRVYARSLSQTEIQADMNTPMGCGANIDDNNECTADACDPVFGVTHTPLPSGTSCSDGNACNGGEVCDGAGTCDPGAPLEVDDGNPCTEDSCDPEAGLVHTPVTDGTLCNDNNACTQADTCQAGACTGADPVVCTAQDQCHAAGTCDPATGACSNLVLADGTACDDGSACTLGEACTAGSCGAGTTAEVDDGNPCTVDSCDAEGGVTHTPVAEGTSCDDGDVCNGAAVCDASGTCQPGTPLTCDDGNACNGVETCQAATGCAAGAPPTVDDGNPCTADSCDPVTGIEHAPVAAGTSCDDGDACNGTETCDASGVCQVGPGSAVDDGNPCTEDSCDPLDGVVHTPVLVGTPCDLDACTVGGTCDSGGFCVGGTSIVPDDGDFCTVETCDPTSGVHSSECTDDATVATTVAASTRFLYTGDNPVQHGVDPSDIVVRRAALISGRVLDRQGVPIPGVRVAVVGHEEFGSTRTQADGSYRMVVNGGGSLRLAFEHQPFLALQRQVEIGWGEWITVPDVVLVAPDPLVTTIDLADASEAFQVHQASVVADADGTRQGTLLVPAGTQATMRFADGAEAPIDSMNVRITEFTVGDTGPLAMPGDLPAVSAYTHAFEVNADEAVLAGAESIVFDQPLLYYVDNFLDFPTGTTVPVGSFNRERGQWLAEENGIVIAVAAVVGGVAALDADGDGVPESDLELEALGIEDDERTKLAELYVSGASLWRVKIPHFTQPYDCNWGILFPDDAEPPPDPPEPPPDPPNKCEGVGSIIECETQVLREVLPLAGTEFSLNYASNRVLGRRDYRTVRIPLSGPTVPASLKRIDLEVKVGGLVWNESFEPLPSQTYDFMWDGHDIFGRSVQGGQVSTSTVTFAYDGVYARTEQFGAVAGVALTGSKSRNELYMTRRREQTVGIWDARVMGFGGWTLNVHHAYDPASGTLQLGDGRKVQALPNQGVVESWPKKFVSDSTTYPGGDGGPADLVDLQDPGAIAAAADGSIYVADGHDPWQSTDPYNLRRIGPDGIINRFAGPGYDGPRGFNGDGLPALETQFSDMSDIEVGPDGSVFVADRGNHRVRRIGPDGIVSTVAGNGTRGFSGDGGLATNARLNEPIGIGLGRGGEIYIADYGNRRVRKVLPNGNIVTIGGSGAAPGPTNPGNGAAMGVADPIAPYDVAEHPDGSVYALQSNRGVVRRYDLMGRVATVAGSWCNGCPAGEAGYGIPALGAKIGYPERIVIGRDGTLYLVDNFRPRVIRVTPAGMLELVAKGADITVQSGGVVQGKQLGDGAPAADLRMRQGVGGVSIGPDGVYFTAMDSDFIYRTRTMLPALDDDTMYVRAPDSQEVYVFDWQGRHVATRTRTGQLVFTFSYDTNGKLSNVVDAFGNLTTIERGPSGEAQSIVGPYGHVTELNVTGNGYLESAVDPANRRVSMTYDEGGLLKSFTDPRNNTSTMEYDDSGRLQSDTDAAGGTQILSSAGDFGTRTITLESGEGAVKSFQITQRPDGVYERVNTFPDGTQAVAEYRADGVVATWLPNGTIQEVASTPDPRFGMQDPETTRRLILPSGLTRVEETKRVVSLSDLTNPLSITSEVTTTTINDEDWVATYTSSTGRTERVSPEGRWQRTFTSPQGRLMRLELPNTLAIDLTYDAHGRLETTVQGTRTSTNTYFNTSDSTNGYLHTSANALGQLTTFERDAIGRVLSHVAPDDSATQFSWDENNNLIGLTPPGKPEHTQGFTPINLQDEYGPPALAGIPTPQTTLAFNLDRQPTTTWRPDGLSFERVYDNAGKLDFIDLPGGIIDYSYFGPTPCAGCAPGALASIAHPSGVNLAYTYDGHLRTSTSWSGAVTGGIQWSNNNDFRVTTETVTTASESAPISYAYDDDGLQTCASPTTCPSGSGAFRVTYDPLLPRPISSVSGAVTDTLTYNAYGELASYSASASGALIFSEVVDTSSAPRDALGRITERTETSGGVTTTYSYEYDLQGRVTEVREDGDLVESYTYDDNGNRLTFETPEGVVSATYDDQDRLQTYGNLVYTYTANGELLTKTDTSTGDVTEYEYDVFGNLVRVDLPNGDVIEYLVDGQNRRVGKRVNGVLVKQWLWASQLRIAAELDGAGSLLSRFVYGDKPTTPELVIQGSAVYRVISDHLGSVRALVNINDPSDVPVRLDYEAFGGVSGTGVGVIPQGFAGGLYDAETGLVRFGARDYEPVVGRWVSKDPVRFEGGVNLFAYANGDPINFVDITGENAITLGIAAAAAATATALAIWGHLMLNQDALADMCKPFAVSRQWKCDASCNVDAVGERYTGYGTGSTQDAACKAAKKDANSRIPRGTYKRHCRCTCSR